MFQYVYAQIVSDNNSERMTKIEKKSSAKLLVTVWFGTIKLKLIYKEYLTAT